MQDNREVIILAAIEQFNMHGIQGASISMIAQAARIAKGTLYYYFKAKEDLIEGAFEYVQRNAKEMALGKIDFNHDPEQIVKQLVRDSLIWPLRYPEQLRFMDSYLHLYFYEKQVYQLFPLGIFDEEHLSARMRRALKPDLPLDLLNTIVGSMLTNFCKYVIINPEFGEEQNFINTMAQVIWDMVSR
ncbi:hypothetical protein AGMMS49587_16850 [Spirochaetia bacterium]|nr:hypothetical protein AGMMS49587_16850 [Spirochaetia bacterium]